MAASSGSAGTGDDEKPPFTFEQIVLRFGVGVIIIVLFVTAVELARVRGRVAELETAAEAYGPGLVGVVLISMCVPRIHSTGWSAATKPVSRGMLSRYSDQLET